MTGSSSADTCAGNRFTGSGRVRWNCAMLWASSSISRAWAGGDGSLPSTASCISWPLRLFMQRPGGLALFSTSFGTLRVRY